MFVDKLSERRIFLIVGECNAAQFGSLSDISDQRAGANLDIIGVSP